MLQEGKWQWQWWFLLQGCFFFFCPPLESQRGGHSEYHDQLVWAVTPSSVWLCVCQEDRCWQNVCWRGGARGPCFLGHAEVLHCGAVWTGLRFGTEVASSPIAPLVLLQALSFPSSLSTAQQVSRCSYLALFFFLLLLGLTEELKKK